MRFTVLSPTFNRAAYLGDLYQSLCVQSFRDFEWLIIDDGSTDDTQELVSSWKPPFSVRYLWKSNGGKHTAVNVGVRQAHGEFILIVDSDDRCLPHTLERFDYWSKRTPQPDNLALIVGLCCDAHGAVLGSSLPLDCVDVFSLRDAWALADADRCGIVRAEVFREFPYPEYSGERFIPESLVWNRIHKKYPARYFNEAVKIAGYAPGGLSSQANLRWSSPKGASLYYKELAFSDVPASLRCRAGANLARYSVAAIVQAFRRPLGRARIS